MGRDYCKKSLFVFMRCRRTFLSDSMLDLLNDPERFMNSKQATIIQDNFKSKLAVIELDSRKLVIKKHNYKSLWHRIKRYFRPTRAARNWHYSEILQDNGIRVPAPVAYVETRIGVLRGMSYFIYEYVEGVTGEVFFKKNARNRDVVAEAMAGIVKLVESIKTAGLIHGDVRVSNLVFNSAGMCLLDMDDIKHISWYHSERARTRDIRGLTKDIWYNIPPTLQRKFLNLLPGAER